MREGAGWPQVTAGTPIHTYPEVRGEVSSLSKCRGLWWRITERQEKQAQEERARGGGGEGRKGGEGQRGGGEEGRDKREVGKVKKGGSRGGVQQLQIRMNGEREGLFNFFLSVGIPC